MEGSNAAASAPKRKRTKLSIDDALAAVETTAAGLEESFRLTDIQETAIRKCFQLIQTKSDDLQTSVQSQKSTRPMTVYRMLHDVRFLLGLKPFLLCALALTPTRMQTMAKDEAARLPSKLQDWWNASTPPSTKLEALARQFEPLDKTIPYIAPDIQLCELSSKRSKSIERSLTEAEHSEPSAQLASHPTTNPGISTPTTCITLS